MWHLNVGTVCLAVSVPVRRETVPGSYFHSVTASAPFIYLDFVWKFCKSFDSTKKSFSSPTLNKSNVQLDFVYLRVHSMYKCLHSPFNKQETHTGCFLLSNAAVLPVPWPKNKLLSRASGPTPLCKDMGRNVRHPESSQMWTGSPPGSARDRWGSSRCLWDVFVPSPGLMRPIWTEAGETDICRASIHSVLNRKPVINSKMRIFLKHIWNHPWPLRVITNVHSSKVQDTAAIQGFGIEPMTFQSQQQDRPLRRDLNEFVGRIAPLDLSPKA